MPKKGYIPFTNQIPKLGTQDFLFYVFRNFRTGRQRSEISHCLVEAMRNRVVSRYK